MHRLTQPDVGSGSEKTDGTGKNHIYLFLGFWRAARSLLQSLCDSVLVQTRTVGLSVFSPPPTHCGSPSCMSLFRRRKIKGTVPLILHVSKLLLSQHRPDWFRGGNVYFSEASGVCWGLAASPSSALLICFFLIPPYQCVCVLSVTWLHLSKLYHGMSASLSQVFTFSIGKCSQCLHLKKKKKRHLASAFKSNSSQQHPC